jgi:pimeloyl-ACP methyl ester carboxylesterase
MSDLVLIHGSCHGAWCWEKLIPALAERGHQVRAIDLPGRGGDLATASLAGMARAVLAGVTKPVVLVGHSAGGYAITAAAEQDPDRVRALVYLCAYLPASGQSLAEMRRAWPDQPLLPAIRVATDRQSFTFDPDQARGLLYHDCTAEDAARATARLCAEPVAPQETPLILRRSGSLPRFYIRCTEDRAIPPAYQAQMAAALPASHRSNLATAHSPFLSAPQLLADRLEAILGQLDEETRD